MKKSFFRFIGIVILTTAIIIPINAAEKTVKLPKMIELGSVRCIPCKMMAPILEDFRKNYSDKFAVEFIDVNEDKSSAKKYSIQFIPTQVFLDGNGKELFRHVGFFPKEDILKKWKELGFGGESKPVVKVEKNR